MTTLKMNNGYPSSSGAHVRTIHNLEDETLVRNLPELNLPEKILFVIDTVTEFNYTPFLIEDDTTATPLKMIKRSVENFISIKSKIQRSHEYALMTLDSKGSKWICDFTNNPKSIVNHLDSIYEEYLDEDLKTYNIGQLFERIEAWLPRNDIFESIGVPTFVTRVILIYARSNCVPTMESGQKALENITENPYFFMDSLFIHEKVPGERENSCNEIYARIADLDRTNMSYLLEVGRSIERLELNVAKLVAHPLQRPPQNETSYSLQNLWQARDF